MYMELNEVGSRVSLPFRDVAVRPSHTTTFINGERIFTQGAPADTIYRVGHGTVIEYRLMPETNERQILSVIHEGGFAGITGGNSYDTTGEAVVGTRLEPISRSSFVAMLLHEPGFAATLQKHLHSATRGLQVTRSSTSTDAELRNWEQPDFFDEPGDNLLTRVASAILNGESRCAHVGSAVSITLANVNASEYDAVDHQTFQRCLLVLRWRQLISFSNAEFIDILDRPGLQRLANGNKVTAIS